MQTNVYDAIVIGCGPAGSTVATFLARAGKKVLVLEKEKFPRFHIGESLLPYNRQIFEEMGVLPRLEAAGFPRKLGAQFCLGNDTKGRRFRFSLGKFTRYPETIQVERAIFDQLLMEHARSCGAAVQEGWAVSRFDAGEEGVRVIAASANGQQEFTAAFLVDASGRANLTGNQEGVRVVHPRLKKMAVFGHFERVGLDAGEERGDTIIARLDNKWFWIIPVSTSKTSVGLVLDKEEFARSGKTLAEIFWHYVSTSRVMRRRMADAQPVNELQATSDFSYYNRRLAGRRLLRTGDAAGFMDPIFSAGVFLAMRSGKLAAATILKAVEQGNDGAALMNRYEQQVNHGMRFYWRMVEGFYTTPFMEIFLEPRHRLELPSAVNAVLAGELEGGWKLRWRLELFFLLIRLQQRWPLVPRLCFDAEATADPFAFLTARSS